MPSSTAAHLQQCCSEVREQQLPEWLSMALTAPQMRVTDFEALHNGKCRFTVRILKMEVLILNNRFHYKLL